jgi:hypothetical protein
VTARQSPWLRRPARLGWRLALIAVVAALAALAAASVGQSAAASASPTASAAAAPVPQGFVGVDLDGPMFASNTPLNLGNQLQSMVANGVQSVRVAFNWARAQPYSSFEKVPVSKRADFSDDVDGRPTDFSATDQIVGEAAQRHLSVLPTILYAPRWDAERNRHGINTPKLVLPYAQYAAALVKRYGPQGTYWAENPTTPMLPIRMWQIWNEPNLTYYWQQPFGKSYVALLGAAHAAIKGADPGAKVVLGALTNLAWESVRQVYDVRGARNLFDIASVNGFTQEPANVIVYMQLMRRAMRHFGDGRKPLLATEVSWPSAQGKSPQHYDFSTTEAGQAQDIAALMPLIGRNRVALGLSGFYYYTWIGQEDPGSLAFNFAGLLGFHNDEVTVKPALAAFRTGVLALEHCHQKGSVANSCVKR